MTKNFLQTAWFLAIKINKTSTKGLIAASPIAWESVFDKDTIRIQKPESKLTITRRNLEENEMSADSFCWNHCLQNLDTKFYCI